MASHVLYIDDQLSLESITIVLLLPVSMEISRELNDSKPCLKGKESV